MGTTVIMQAIYYNKLEQPVDADRLPTVELKDKQMRTIQTGLNSIRIATGTYQCKYGTKGLGPGTYFYFFYAVFDGDVDIESGSFKLVLAKSS